MTGLGLSSKKNKIKEIISKRKSELDILSGKIKSTKDILKDIKTFTKAPKFPISSNISEKEVKEKYLNLETESKRKKTELDIEITNLSKEIIEATTSQIEKAKLESYIQEKKNQLSEIEKKIDMNVYNEEYYNNLVNFKKYKETLIEVNNLQNTKEELENKYIKEKEIFDTQLQKKLTDIENELWQDGTKEDSLEAIENLEDCLKDFQQYENACQKLSTIKIEQDFSHEILELQQSIKQYEKELEKCKISKKVLKCPCCKSSLLFKNDVLEESIIKEISDDRTELSIQKSLREHEKRLMDLQQKQQIRQQNLSKKEELETIISDIQKIYEEIQTTFEIKSQILSYREYIQKNLQREDLINKLSGEKSPLLIDIEKQLKVINTKLISYKKLVEDTSFPSYEDVDTEIIKQKISKETLIDLKEQYENIKKDYDKTQIIFQKLLEKSGKDINKIQEKIEDDKKEICILNEKLEKCTLYLKKIEEYERDKKDYDTFKKYQENLKKDENSEIEMQKKYESILFLKESISKSESIFLQKFILDLNKSVQKYINMFFTEDPMTLTLRTQRSNSKQEIKSQINLLIDYKGNEFDVSNLSGGEYDRVNLAITLSFAEMYGIPLLVLDECISSLDYTNFNNVIDCIRDNYLGNHVIVVSHQANEGLFDNIVQL